MGKGKSSKAMELSAKDIDLINKAARQMAPIREGKMVSKEVRMKERYGNRNRQQATGLFLKNGPL